MDAGSDPFADELTLPQLPALPLSRESSGQDAATRKRTYPFRAPSTERVPSSDTGVFSSDDDPTLDNYSQARQKRRYRGTWYDHDRIMSDARQDDDDSQEDVVPETPKAKDRSSRSDEPRRNAIANAAGGGGQPPPTPPSSNPVASHVFTPSRRTPSSQGLVSSSQQTFSPGQRFASSQGLPSSQGYVTEPVRKQLAVVEEIERRIDRGESLIDLTNIGLDDESISADTFRPLIDLKLVPRVKARTVAGRSKDPLTTSKEGYLHRESAIVLIMANNRLTRVPGTLFDIENLVELSLRHNQLTELPPAIAKCRNLRSLNLSFNRLRWLPYELVELLPRLRALSLAGNDFYEPEASCVAGWSYEGAPFNLMEDRGSLSATPESGSVRLRSLAWYVGRGPVQYSDTSGRVYSSFRLPQSGPQVKQVPLQSRDEHTPPLSHYQGEAQARPGSNQGFGASRVPSLVELCARSLAASGEQFPKDFGDVSGVLAAVASAAARSRSWDGQRCAICNKSFVISRSQWIEFFYIAQAMFVEKSPRPLIGGETSRVDFTPGEDFVLRNLMPCLRSGCSWRCVPYKTELRSGQLVPLKG